MQETSAKDDSEHKKDEYKVVIIGAGIAGLSAANHLLSNNCNDFVILEARNRVGGRIIGIDLDPTTKVELGANWIHGILGNPMFEIAMAHGLIDIVKTPKPHSMVARTESGHTVPFDVLSEIYDAYVVFLRRCEEYFLSEYCPPDGIHSVGDHIALEVELYLEKINNASEKHLKRLIFDCLLKRETCITGCDSMREIDLLEMGSYAELQGGNVALPNGYSCILKPICKDIPDARIWTNCVAKRVNWLERRVDCSQLDDSDDSDRTVVEESMAKNEPTKRQRNVIVTCEVDNKTRKLHADHVICTIPLGVLKDRHESLFQPSLPEAKIDAINHLLFGTVDKIFLKYDRPFLPADIFEVMLLWEPCDLDNDDISTIWFRKIYSFAKVSDTVLLAWISGKEAEYMETLDFQVVGEKCTDILRKFLNDPFVPQPKKCVCTSWSKQPYTRGSYTSMAVGASQLDIEQLAQPLYANATKPVVMFAGEHTHTTFYSTVHGAYLSGRTAAQILVENEPDDAIAEEGQEWVLDCDDTNDLSSWIQGISLN